MEQDQISVSTRKKADALDNYQDQVDSSQLEIKVCNIYHILEI